MHHAPFGRKEGRDDGNIIAYKLRKMKYYRILVHDLFDLDEMA
jgi:hypothetical protein